MSWQIGLHIDSTVAEITAIKADADFAAPGNLIQKRWYLPKLSLEEGLRRFFADNSQISTKRIKYTTSFLEHVLEKRAGDPPALLVTLGFENWPFLRQPLQTHGFTLRPKRTAPLLSSDLVFGVTERVLASGEIQKDVDMSEVEFLVSKLQFTGTKNVAVCFLHSSVNPANEKKVGEFLKQNGFEVTLSSDAPSTSNEVARWWRAFSGSYLAAAHTEFLKPLEKMKADGWEFVPSPGALIDSITANLNSLTELWNRLQKDFDILLYAGYDRFAIIDPGQPNPILQTDFGPILVNSRASQRDFRLCPNQEVGVGQWGGPDFSTVKTPSDPGPMAFGRSLRPTLFDTLLANNAITPEQLPEGVTNNAPKILESLNMISKTAKQDGGEATKYLMSMLRDETYEHLCEQKARALMVGPLSTALHKVLGKKVGACDVALLPWSDWAKSLSVALAKMESH